MVRCIFVEKKDEYDVEGKSLLEDFKNNLGVNALKSVKLINKYTLGEVKEEDYKKALHTIFSERTVDKLYENNIELREDETAFAVEYLPGQYDQRADSASECYAILTSGEKLEVKWTKIIVLRGNLLEDEIDKIKKYYINPVDSREVKLDNLELYSKLPKPKDVEILNGFIKASFSLLNVVLLLFISIIFLSTALPIILCFNGSKLSGKRVNISILILNLPLNELLFSYFQYQRFL